MKLTNFEFGSVQIVKNQVLIQIPKSEFKYDSLNELNEIKNSENPNFLPITEIRETEKNNRVELISEIPEGFFSFDKIKNEDLIVKLSIVKTILEDDVLGNENNFVSIHPSTLFYKPMSTVKYTYMANHLMPHGNRYSDLDRYKALVLSVLSGLSYEIYLNNKEQSKKIKNELVKSILEVKSREELLEDLERLLEYKQYSHFKVNQQDKTKKKFQRISVIAVSFLVLILAVGITKSIANKEHAQVVAQFEQEIENIKEENALQQHLVNGDYDKAAESMRNLGKKNNVIAEMFLDAGLYQQALDADPDYLNSVIEVLYAEEQKDVILDLKMKSNEQLETEKQIITYDYTELKAKQHFINDENTTLRLGKAYVEHGDLEDALLLQERINNDELGDYIVLKQKQNELQKNKDNLSTLEKEIEDEEDKGEKKDKENQIKIIKEKIESLEKEIEELRKS